ncbi:type IV pilus twitching motility protein PilT [Limnohabitans sp.]|uniref:type IV pilus twitching motility protein PilT n=1 Tax=Limnohabitans sp. TaxID=1907725 RepID=UPI0038BB4D11
MNIHTWLTHCIDMKGSDLHLRVGEPPVLRIDGDLHRCDSPALRADDMAVMVDQVMQAEQRAFFAQHLECDLSYEVKGLSRFRINAFHHSGGMSLACRVVPNQAPRLSELHAPALLGPLACSPRGLILVTGPTGSGKSTTLAAMIQELNLALPRHVLTIEDPVEFVHTPQQCLIHQRELGAHTQSFANALRAGLREDPDVILVGEMRDLDTIRLAITAAETGHLVLASLHASEAVKSVDRMVDVFPADEKDMVRTMLSESLSAVVYQVLCKRRQGPGRVAAYEVMLATPAVRHLIREGKAAQMYSAIQTGAGVGMQTLDQSLAWLVKQGAISADEARSKAKFPDQLPLA